ncbi:hypothetical protein H2198_010829 [Neophaeococcomyces mojaviensis]|uniref:Uncharacterized protein n=1 Tax=Neophaeococcomyces mojaviensis TaxID=3383035 RepID=A0ACC2ZQV9_9EURO|nr:hypothetical protein H2198_010829 [Knufia sp. JES_112]
MLKIPHQVTDFVVLPVTIRSKALNNDVKHYIYIKAYEPKIPDEESPRALFLVNIPVTTTEAQLRHLLTTQLSAGHIQHIYFAEKDGVSSASPSSLIATTNRAQTEMSASTTLGKRKRHAQPSSAEISAKLQECRLPATVPSTFHATGSTAIAVFLDRPSRDLTLRACRRAAKSKSPLIWSANIEADKLPPLGLARFEARKQLTFPARTDLLRQVDEYMTTYSELEAARTRESLKKRAEPDEEGFVTVTRGSRGVVKADEAEAIKVREEEKKRKNRSGSGLDDFYRFQMRERRKEEQGKLLRQFEEEKRRVEEMRRGRGKLVPQS